MIGIQLPNGQVVHIDTTDPRQAAEAGKRIWSQQQATTDAQAATARQSGGPIGRGADRALEQAQTFGFGDEMAGGAAALSRLVQNTVSRAQGKEPAYGVADAYRATVDAERAANEQWAGQHPKANAAVGVLGSLTPGAGTPAKGLLGMIGQGMTAGGVFGGLTGAGNAQGGLGERAKGAGAGAALGAAVGGAVPAAVRGGAVTGKTAMRLANRASGGNLLNPQKEAASRLAEALRADGLDPTSARKAARDWAATGASGPALMDVGGENTRALVRAAGTKGPARQQAAKYADAIVSDLQDNAIRQTNALTPDQRPAQVVADELREFRGNQATTDYAPAYAQTINITPEVASALRGPEGNTAINMAISGERANRQYDAVRELERLRTAAEMPELPAHRPVNPYYTRATTAPPLEPTTGRALDRVQMMLGRMGEENYQLGDGRAPYVGKGLFDRQAAINKSLDDFEGLKDARAAFKGTTEQMRAIDTGQGILNAPPNAFNAPAGSEGALGVGARDALATALGSPAEGSTGVLRRIATSTNMGEKLGTAFGSEGDRYRQGLANEISRVENARFADTRSGPKTANLLIDVAENFPVSKAGLLSAVIEKLRSGVTLTDKERLALVVMGQADGGRGAASLSPAFARSSPWASALAAPTLAREAASQ